MRWNLAGFVVFASLAFAGCGVSCACSPNVVRILPPTTTTTTVSPTTTTTLPAPLALGTSALLTVPSSPGPSQVTVTITRTWIGVTPVFDTVIPGGLAHALKFLHAPAKLQWIGIAFSMANTGPQPVGIISNGRYQPYIQFVVSGQESGRTMPPGLVVAQLGFYAGFEGCPYPFAGGPLGLPVGATVTGCLAVPIPAWV